VNVGELASFLDSIRLTAGPLLALSIAIRPAKRPVTTTSYSSVPKQNIFRAVRAFVYRAGWAWISSQPSITF
jgi:mediator of RNA polymerase II transcription subunit 14